MFGDRHYEEDYDKIRFYKQLKSQFPEEMRQLGISLLQSGLRNSTVPFEEIDTTVDLKLLEICLVQQRQLNLITEILDKHIR